VKFSCITIRRGKIYRAVVRFIESTHQMRDTVVRGTQLTNQFVVRNYSHNSNSRSDQTHISTVAECYTQ